jgi:hypothetical protein
MEYNDKFKVQHFQLTDVKIKLCLIDEASETYERTEV